MGLGTFRQRLVARPDAGEDEHSGLLSQPNEVDGRLDRFEVYVACTAGNKDEVRDLASCKRRRLGVRRSINEGVIRSVLGGGFQNVRQDGGLRGDDDGSSLSPTIVPRFRAGLRVEVDDDDLLAGGFGCPRKVDRERCLPSAPFCERIEIVFMISTHNMIA